MVEIITGSIPLDLPKSAFTGEVPEFLHGAFKEAKPDPEDGRLAVRFAVSAKLMHAQSTLQGRPVFENVDIIKIRTPEGEEIVNELPIKNGKPHWKRVWYSSRFPLHWEKFQKERAAIANGTPLNMVVYDPSILATLGMANVQTVEQLAHTEGSILSIPGIAEAKSRAIKFVENQDLLAIQAEDKEALRAERDAALKELEELRKILAAKEEDSVEQDYPSDNSGSSKKRKA